MKKIAALVVILCFFIGVIPAVAKTPFQAMSDGIAELCKTRPVPAGANTVFQKAKANIETWDNTSAQAEPHSLRGNKEEIARRRGIKR